MTMSLVFGIRLSPNSFQRVKVDGINLDSKVESLKIQASKTTNLPIHFLELIYCGNILDDNATLRSCGLKPGVMIHVVKKKEGDSTAPPRNLGESDIRDLVVAFRTFTRHPGYRSALLRLSRPEVLEYIITATPGLNNDPVALSILQDPELLVHMENSDTVRRIVELHPALAEAANHIAAAVHEEAVAGNIPNPASTSGYSYSLEALSDEEEMDSSQPRVGDNLGALPAYPGITAAQLAAALASATATPRVSGPTPSTSSAAASGPASGSTSSAGSMITSEMFSQAIQQAIANVGPATSIDTPSTSTGRTLETSADVEVLTRRLSRQLQQMRELGLTDNAINLQALQATGGDVHAAIDLVFSGAITPDSH